jgi:REP element-mobilizing transposase RayT
MSEPLAYLLTWTTYGSWLPGDLRGWVEQGVSGIQLPDVERKCQAIICMTDDAVVLDAAQREIVETTIRDHCAIRNWQLHAVNVRTNHVHVVASAGVKPEEVMRQFKAWCSRRLSDHSGLGADVTKQGRKRWWTEHGSTKWINDDEYLMNAIRYVIEGQ